MKEGNRREGKQTRAKTGQHLDTKIIHPSLPLDMGAPKWIRRCFHLTGHEHLVTGKHASVDVFAR